MWALLVASVTASGAHPIRGWMSWERYTCETDCARFPDTCIGERLFRTMADEMVRGGWVDAGFTSIQIDDCWSAAERQDGRLVADPVRFPSGIKALADYVHSKGMQLGIYGDIGSKTCGGFIGFNVSAEADPAADAQLEQDAEDLLSWGIDSLKVDGCYARWQDMNVTYPKLGAALARAAKQHGRPSPWYSCSWPDYVADGGCDHSRTAPCIPWPQIARTCDSARLWMDIADTWNNPIGNGAGVKNIIDFWAKNPQLAELRNGLPRGTSYFNDPDQLLIGNNGLSRTEAEIQMGMWAMFSAPMIMSVELRNGSMPEEMKKILTNREVLAISDDDLALQATLAAPEGSVLYSGSTSVWNKSLADGSVAVALLNTGDFGNVGKSFGNFNISIDARKFGLSCTDGYAARDLFGARAVPIGADGRYWHEVDETSIVLLRVRCAAAASPPVSADPSSSWLAYAEFKADGIITTMNLTTVVPANPKEVGADPSFWYGLQTEAGTGALIQPILAWGQSYRDGWGIFHEVFDWNDSRDSRSPETYRVKPGDVLTQSVVYRKETNSYDMYIASNRTGKSILWNYKLERRQKVPETVAYIVVEHRPERCAQFPADGGMTFSDIYVEVDNAPVVPHWTTHTETEACFARATVGDPKSVSLHWRA